MNVLFISIDSLRRDVLNAYFETPLFSDYDVATPNLDRFADRAATFETHYAGSLPCMPARREWLTGTKEFLWRPWGPIEPFDETIPRLARHEGVVTQLITDHYHHFQHGSAGYYEDFNGFEFIRGHEFDSWQTSPYDPDDQLLGQITNPSADDVHGTGYMNRTVYARNAAEFDDETDFFPPKVFSRTAEWLQDNQEWDQWFCYVDSFDVHEPFHVPEPYASMYTDEDPRDPELPVWPFYGPVGGDTGEMSERAKQKNPDAHGQSALTERQLDFVRAQYAGNVTFADEWFGRVLDRLDEDDLWEETMVIVTSDHGFYLGEHDWIGKPEAPLYDVLAHTPLFVWHPESEQMGERIPQLTTAVDLYATILDALNVPDVDPVHSQSLVPLLHDEVDEHRDYALYGYWGTSLNVTDGEYTYLRACDERVESDCHSTTMMNPHAWFTPTRPKPDAESGQFLPYTDSPVWRYSAPSYRRNEDTMLFESEDDPLQQRDLIDEHPEVHDRMRSLLVTALRDLDAPENQYDRLGLSTPS